MGSVADEHADAAGVRKGSESVSLSVCKWEGKGLSTAWVRALRSFTISCDWNCESEFLKNLFLQETSPFNE